MAKEKKVETMSRHSVVFDYWKDKCITRNGRVVVDSKASTDDVDVVTDWGEPSCWACSLPVGDDSWVKPSGLAAETMEEVYAIWNHRSVTSKLNRCHIVPKALGGDGSAENLFLMCECCHNESPDTTNREAFFRWVYDKRRGSMMGVDFNSMIQGVEQEANRRGGVMWYFSKTLDVLYSGNEDELKQRTIEKYSKSINTHGAKFSDSSRRVARTDMLETLVFDKIKQLQEEKIDKSNCNEQRGTFFADIEGHTVYVYRNDTSTNWRFSIPDFNVCGDTGVCYNDLAREVATRRLNEIVASCIEDSENSSPPSVKIGGRVYWTVGGELVLASDYCKENGLNYVTISNRMEKYCLTAEQAAELPDIPSDRKNKPVEYWEEQGFNFFYAYHKNNQNVN